MAKTYRVHSLPKPSGPTSGTDLRLLGPQTDTSQNCKIMNMGWVHCTVCLFTSPVPNYTASWQRQWGTRNLTNVYMQQCS